jgi:adenine-specific DNA methylase
VASKPIRATLARFWEEFTDSRQGLLVLNGDSSRLPVPDKSVDAVVTDPPYFDFVHYTALHRGISAFNQLRCVGKPDAAKGPGFDLIRLAVENDFPTYIGPFGTLSEAPVTWKAERDAARGKEAPTGTNEAALDTMER